MDFDCNRQTLGVYRFLAEAGLPVVVVDLICLEYHVPGQDQEWVRYERKFTVVDALFDSLRRAVLSASVKRIQEAYTCTNLFKNRRDLLSRVFDLVIQCYGDPITESTHFSYTNTSEPRYRQVKAFFQGTGLKLLDLVPEADHIKLLDTIRCSDKGQVVAYLVREQSLSLAAKDPAELLRTALNLESLELFEVAATHYRTKMGSMSPTTKAEYLKWKPKQAIREILVAL